VPSASTKVADKIKAAAEFAKAKAKEDDTCVAVTCVAVHEVRGACDGGTRGAQKITDLLGFLCAARTTRSRGRFLQPHPCVGATKFHAWAHG